MARETKEDQLQEVHCKAVTEFDRVQSALRDERLLCLQDRRFYSIAGAQWEGSLGSQFANRPRFEVNKCHLAVIRIINEYRANPISVSFVPQTGDKSASALADACAALYRADEQDSSAEEAYDNAFEEAVGGGFGAWRLRAEYEDEEDEDNEYQRIRFEPIFDADSCVFFDLDAKRQDKSDARCAWVLTALTYEAYKEEWGDDPASWDKTVHQREFDWSTPDVVYVAEYYEKECIKDTVYTYTGIDGAVKKIRESELKDDDSIISEWEAAGYKKTKEKKIKVTKVHKYLMSGSKVLEDCGYIAGKNIPIVPVYGKRWVIDNIERCMGHVRLAKDPQRLKNVQLSKLGELSVQSGVEKPIMTAEQVSGYQLMWAEDNIKNYPYLLVNSLKNPDGSVGVIGPASYTRSPQISPALAALLQVSEQDMKDLLGNQQNGEELQPNLSGKAIELVQGKLDMQSFIYVSNMAKAVKRSGEIWLGMAKDILQDSGRMMKGIGPQGEVEGYELLRAVINEDGETEYENDLSCADFDVAVDVGPSSSSKRQSAANSLMAMMNVTQDPETIQVLSAMAMMNMEGEGVEEARDYFRRKLVRMGVVKPTKEEQQQLAAEAANKAPDPQAQYLQAAAEQAQADATKARAETVLTVAKAEKTKADTAEVLAGMSISEQQHFLDVASKLDDANRAQPTTASTQPIE